MGVYLWSLINLYREEENEEQSKNDAKKRVTINLDVKAHVEESSTTTKEVTNALVLG